MAKVKAYFNKYEKGNTKGFASVEINGQIKINNFAVLKGNNGPWVGNPSRPKQEDGETKYYPVVSFPDKDLEKEVHDAILEEAGLNDNSTSDDVDDLF